MPADGESIVTVSGPATSTPAPTLAESIENLTSELNIDFEALKALAYDGTRAENADNFRDQGNEAAQEKDWMTAKDFYSKALATLLMERRGEEVEELKKDGPGWELREEEKERGLKEKCLANRALCHLSLKNYRSCTTDCNSALEINPRNVKAYYRLAQASLALSKLDEASKAVEAGLKVDPENQSLSTVKPLVDDAIKTQKAREDRKNTNADRKAQEERTLNAALAARQIKIRSTNNPPELEDAKMTLSPDPADPTSSLIVPVLVLYPLHARTDFIKAFGEEQTIATHLEYLLPLPWDEKQEYGSGKADKIEAYLGTSEGGLVKWGRKVELLRLLSGGKVEIVDGVVTVNVVPKARSDEFISEFKRRHVKSRS